MSMTIDPCAKFGLSSSLTDSSSKSLGANFGLVVRGNPRIITSSLQSKEKGYISVELPLSSSPCSVSDATTTAKESKQDEANLLAKHQSNREILFKSRSRAGRTLKLVQPAKDENFKNRVCVCAKYLHVNKKPKDAKATKTAKGYVTLVVDKDTHHAHIEGIIYCGSQWLCAPCAVIGLNKKAEIITTVQKNFLKAGADKDWSTWMLTLTIPHKKIDLLANLLDKKAEVMSELHAHSQMKLLKARIGWKGYVDSLEVRHSDKNGWHPHHHILGFFTNMHPNTFVQSVYDAKRGYYRIATQNDKQIIKRQQDRKTLVDQEIIDIETALLTVDAGSKKYDRLVKKLNKLNNITYVKLEKIEVKLFIYKLFAYLCEKHKLGRPSFKHGVDFRKSDDINDYLTKHSKIALELTNDMVKTSKGSYSRSNWEIERDCSSDNPKIAAESKRLFCEFALATQGKAKIHWSPDFAKQWLDEEAKEEEAECLESEDEKKPNTTEYYISEAAWMRFFSYSRERIRKLLNIAEKDSMNGTIKTAIYLNKLEQTVQQEHDDRDRQQAEYIAENEQLYQKWLATIPNSYYENEAQKVYDYDDYVGA